MNIKFKDMAKIVAGAVFLNTVSLLHADDTEMFFSSDIVNPNILFVLDVSGSMDEVIPGSGGDEVVEQTLVRTVSAREDDAEQQGKYMQSLSSSDLELTKESNQQQIGIRFRNIGIPQGATIKHAYIQFQTDEVSNDPKKKIKIRGHRTDNAGEFTSSKRNISNRSRTNATVYWKPERWESVGERGEDQKTNDLNGIVQEIVNRGGWESGNAMVFILEKGENAEVRRTAESFDGDASAAPELTIVYEAAEPEKTRLKALQSALKVVLENAPPTINVGLMNYGEVAESDSQLGIKFPVKNINEGAFDIVHDSLPVGQWGTEWWRSNIPEPEKNVAGESEPVRTYLSSITDWFWRDNWYREKYDNQAVINRPHVGTTPIVEALYEAALYFRGDKVGWGLNESNPAWNTWGNAERTASHPSTYEGDAIQWDQGICKSTYKKTWWGRKWRFAQNEKDWARCPPNAGDTSSNQPGTYANCPGTEVHGTYDSCIRRAPRGGGQCLEYYPRDESGNRKCKRRAPRTGGNCLEYDEKDKYTYTLCDGDFTSKPNYTSPITSSCQSSFIVLLSDGKPQYSSDWDWTGNKDGTNSKGPTYYKLEDGDWPALVDKTDATKTFDHTDCVDNQYYASGTCGPKLTEFLSKQDQGGAEGVQLVDTFAIGFGLGDPNSDAALYLKSLVTTTVKNADGIEVPAYFSAENEDQLKSVFDNLLQKIGASTSALASPGYSVNVKSSIAHDDNMYIPIFNKRLQPRWSGNLKKFKLVDSINAANGKKSRKIMGKNGKVATSETGVFEEDAWDFWSDATAEDGPDGRIVEKGGVAEKLVSANRNLFTNLSCTSNCALSNPTYALSNNNNGIDNDILELSGDDATAEYREELVKFIRGQRWDTDTEAYVERKHMGDMMHSKPVVVNYGSGESASQVIFAATNEGYLHAFDTESGEELFAFMPGELLKNIDGQYRNSELGTHIYGVDGAITTWEDDDNNRKMLYFGLRRGGKSYYALDITSKTSPVLKWMVTGGSVNDGGTGGIFTDLGETWSQPYLANIKTATGPKPHIIFSGGYNVNQDLYADSSKNPLIDPDDETSGRQAKAAVDTFANEIFVVDALGGPSVFSWSLNDSDLKHSIPGGLRVVDMNRDGAIDRMYFADTGGKVWRLDLPHSGLSGSTLTEFADLSGGASETRKFYNEPDVSLLNHKGTPYLSISIGSGYRAHPMDKTVEDKFYVLIDQAVYDELPDTFSTINESSDLVDVEMTIADGTVSVDLGELADENIIDMLTRANDKKHGWSLDLPSEGEKVLATSVTRDGYLLFTTLAPDAANDGLVVIQENACGAPPSQGRFYSLDLLTGLAMKTIDEHGNKVDRDYIEVVTDSEIPGSPQLIFDDPDCDDATKECEQLIGARVNKKASEVLNLDSSFLEPVYWSDPVKK